MIQVILGLERQASERTDPSPVDAPMAEDDWNVLESLFERIRNSEPLPSEHPTPTETTPGAATLGPDAGHGDED